jgi:isopentenyl-diphosphate delta-isomerase
MTRNKVVLVDRFDNALGEMDKLEAHLKGHLHRAFSIFLFNSEGKMLIHQRAFNKYHSAGLWTNTCCSHPQWEEDIKQSAMDRLQYEMGMQCNFEKAFSFIYNAQVEGGLIEHEFDHVFIGHTNSTPDPHPDEVQNYEWTDPGVLQKRLMEHPDKFTFWFKKALPKVLNQLQGYRRITNLSECTNGRRSQTI